MDPTSGPLLLILVFLDLSNSVLREKYIHSNTHCYRYYFAWINVNIFFLFQERIAHMLQKAPCLYLLSSLHSYVNLILLAVIWILVLMTYFCQEVDLIQKKVSRNFFIQCIYMLYVEKVSVVKSTYIYFSSAKVKTYV